MSNFEDFETRYLAILNKIDALRAKGVSDSDPEMKAVKMLLRDFLELKKRNSTAIQKVIPRLTGVKTVSITTKQLGESVSYNKYTLMGTALGICALLYYYFSENNKQQGQS